MKKFRKIVLLCAVASLAIAAPAAIVFSANGEVSLNGEYSAYYGRNEIVEIVDGFYDKSGVKTKMNKKLIFPDGSTVKNDFVKLTDVGIYVVEYSISDVSERKTFEVRPSAAGLFERANGFTVTGNVDSYEYMDEKSNGVLLTATKSGATIDYGGIIELDEESKSVSELTPLIDMCFMPKTAGIFEIGELYLRFSDVYDESKYFEVKVVSGINDGEPQNAYIAATTNLGYTHIGLLDFGYRQAISELGTGVKSSLAGKIEGRESGNFQIYYSTNENALYCAPAVLGSGLVLDFDDPAMVGAGNIWSGFTGKEVKLTVSVPKAYSDEGSVLVKSIGGFALNGEYYSEIDDYSIGIDFGGYAEENLPAARVGGSYPVFEAFAYNNAVGISKNVSAQVYFEEDMSEIPVKSGRFETEKEGRYILRYKLGGAEGVGIYKDVIVTAEATVSDLKYTSEYLINGQSATGEKNASAGTVLTIKRNGFSGGIGTVEFVSSVIKNGKNIQPEIVGDKEIYILAEDGEYSVNSYVYDFLGEKIQGENLLLNVAYDEKPVIDDISVPEYLIFGHKFRFDIPEASVYTRSGVRNEAVKLYINNRLCSDGVFTPQSKDDIVVKYVAGNAETTYTVKVIGNKIPESMADYFYITGATAKESADGLCLTSESGAARAVFGKKVLADKFSLALKVNNGYDKFNTAVINLQDSVNPLETCELKIAAASVGGQKQLQLFINGEMSGVLPGAFGEYVSLSIDNKKGLVFDEYGNEVGVINTFNSEYCYFDLVLNGEDKFDVTIEGLCSQSLDFLFDEFGRNDVNEPIFTLEKGFSSRNVKFGEKIDLPAIYAFDVKDDEVYGEILLTAPNGEVLYKGSADHGYSFIVDEKYGYGKYMVSYKAADGQGNETDEMSNTYSLFVTDTAKPVIKINGKLPENLEIKIGTELDIPAYSVSDNLDESVKSGIYLIDEYGRINKIDAGKYQFNVAGKFKLLYYATDSNYNSETVVCTIKVREG